MATLITLSDGRQIHVDAEPDLVSATFAHPGGDRLTQLERTRGEGDYVWLNPAHVVSVEDAGAPGGDDQDFWEVRVDDQIARRFHTEGQARAYAEAAASRGRDVAWRFQGTDGAESLWQGLPRRASEDPPSQ